MLQPAEVVHVGPDEAREMLERNRRNRRVSKHRIKKYAQAMQRGEWIDNGDTVKFAANGDLLDGQHRLFSIIEANRTVPMRIVRGLSHAAFSKIDTGRPRGLKDSLHVQGEERSVLLAAAVTAAYRYDIAEFSNSETQLSYDQLLNYLREWPVMRHCVKLAAVDYKAASALITPTITAMCLFAGYRSEQSDKSEEFFKQIIGELPSTNNNPAFLLRDKMAGSRPGKDRLMTWAYSVKAWNAHVQDSPMRRLVFNNDREQRPTFHGWVPGQRSI